MILGDICVYLTKLDLQFRAFGSQVRSLPSKNDLPELIRGDPRGSPGIRGCAQSDIWPAARNPPSLAPGARMT